MKLSDLKEKEFVTYPQGVSGMFEIHVKRIGHKYAEDIYRLDSHCRAMLVDILLEAGYKDKTERW